MLLGYRWQSYAILYEICQQIGQTELIHVTLIIPEKQTIVTTAYVHQIRVGFTY